jgi:hypothetical protein
MEKRKTINKKLRFEIFKRDGFQCAYCGQAPPAVILEVDHIEPKSKGGKDDINNYITACFDCNRGKKDIPLDKIPSSLSENIEVLKEKEEQIAEYRKFIKSVDKRIDKDAREVEKVFQCVFKDRYFTDTFINGTVKRFLKELPLHEITDAMRISLAKQTIPDNCIKYFCGICWNKIKTKTDPNYSRIHPLKKYWELQPRGSGYLPKNQLRLWVDKYSDEEIKRAMDLSQGIWNDLYNILEGEK